MLIVLCLCYKHPAFISLKAEGYLPLTPFISLKMKDV